MCLEPHVSLTCPHSTLKQGKEAPVGPQNGDFVSDATDLGIGFEEKALPWLVSSDCW